MSLFKPMLADAADLNDLHFPLLASAKLDGIRAIVINGKVMSRSLKPIPNQYVQAKFSHLEYADGELIYGSPTAHDVYRQTSSVVMSHNKEEGRDVSFYAFDHILHPTEYYIARYNRLSYDEIRVKDFVKHRQHHIATLENLLSFEQRALDEGYEGLILRNPHSAYKFGRSTTKEGVLLKLKRFVDAEATVIGFEERMHNGNEATTNELGRTKRSSHQENKSGRGDLGALICRTPDGVEFNIGTGFDDPSRAEIWGNRDHYLGRLAKYKFFPVGQKEAPRHPVFLGWRDPIDL